MPTQIQTTIKVTSSGHTITLTELREFIDATSHLAGGQSVSVAQTPGDQRDQRETGSTTLSVTGSGGPRPTTVGGWAEAQGIDPRDGRTPLR